MTDTYAKIAATWYLSVRTCVILNRGKNKYYSSVLSGVDGSSSPPSMGSLLQILQLQYFHVDF